MMSEKVEFEEEVVEEKNVWVENGRKFYLAGLGMAVMAQEEFTTLFEKLVDRGAETEKKTRERVNKEVDARQKEIRKTTKRVEDEVEKRLEGVLHRMNIPSKNDIEKLNKTVTRLNKKVNELSKAS